MKKILIIIMIMFLYFGDCIHLHAVNNDSIEILAIVKSVHKQDIRTFLRIEIKESVDNKVKYYERFFTREVSRLLTKTIAESEGKGVTVGPFGQGLDPRYGNNLMVDIDETESDWYKHIPARKVKKIKYHTPTINNFHATMYVDTMLKGSGEEQRSIYYLEKTSNGWRISNIVCGPKDDLERNENERQGFIYSIL